MGDVSRDIEGVLGVIDTIEAQSDPAALLAALAAYTQTLGFLHVSIAQILNPALASRDLRYYGESDFPQEWQENWLVSNYAMHDPIVRYALRSRAAFTWDEARDMADAMGQRVHDTSRDYGLVNGLAIPIAIGNRPPGVISLAHNGLDFSEKEIATIELVCIHAYTRFAAINEEGEFLETSVSITPREREILHFIAAGRTAGQVGKVLGISETTVVKHLANLSMKLETSNRIHTVTRCIRTGAILP